MKDKRIYPRTFPQSVMGVIFSLLGEDEEHIGMVNDISSDGLGICSCIHISPGTMLKVLPGECEERGSFWENPLLGEVRWCAPGEWQMEIYHLGITIIRKVIG